MSKKIEMELEKEKAEKAKDKVNIGMEKLGFWSEELVETLNTLQRQFDLIRNMPPEEKWKYKKTKELCSGWLIEVKKVENAYMLKEGINKGAGMVGTTAGVGVAAAGPSVAMGLVSTFGVASTGTPIAALSGAAAQNAALAALGGGAIAANGGGMVAGRLVLSLFGPVGIGISIASLLASGVLIWKNINDRNRVFELFTAIYKRDTKTYSLGYVEISEKIKRISKENASLKEGIAVVESFGRNYNLMSDSEKLTLGTYLNLMYSTAELLVEPVKSLQPKYTKEDLEEYKAYVYSVLGEDAGLEWYVCYEVLLLYLINFIYGITLDERDKKLLHKTFKGSKEFLKTMDISKKEFSPVIMDIICGAIEYKNS